MPTLEVDGATLNYETAGDSSAPALLLLHAGIATLRMWDAQVPALAVDHNVIRYDARGFGETRTANVPFSDRDDALVLLDYLGVPTATIVGCSRGGTIAIDLAVEHPDRVSGLVVSGSKPSGFPSLPLTEREDALFDEQDRLLEAEDWDGLVRSEVELWAFGPERRAEELDPDFVQTAYALGAANAVHYREELKPTPLEPPAYDRLVDIDVPTLVMVGAHDLSETLAHYEYLISTIPNADGCLFPDAAHLPSVEAPQEFGRVVVDWLREHDL